MLQVGNDCYYVTGQKTPEMLGIGMVILWPPEKVVKKGTLNIILLVNQSN